MMQRTRLLVVAAVTMLALSGIATASPSALATTYPCTALPSGHPDNGDAASQTYQNANGVNAQIYVPTISQLANIDGQYSDADIFITGADGGFVQFGWYYGQTSTGLTQKTTINAWWGEDYPGAPGGEKLHPLGVLTQGTFHSFRILASTNVTTETTYKFYLDGSATAAATTQRNHDSGQAAFNGETWLQCTTMLGIAARSPSNGAGTLWYHTAPDGWLQWPIPDGYYRVFPSCCASYSGMYDYWGSNYATAGG
jgi:hypothetical protein